MDDFSFGVFADVQFGQREPSIGRDYRGAWKKVQNYMDVFGRERVDFMVHMGDLIDEPPDSGRGTDSLRQMTDLIGASRIPCVWLVGNHDSGSVPRSVLEQFWGFSDDRFYFSFERGAFCFIVLDSNYRPDGVPYEPDTHTWDQCYIPEEQLAWLRNTIGHTKAGYIVVLVHALLDPGQGGHMVRNAEQVREILENSRRPVVVLQGHKHSGDMTRHHGIAYYTLKGTVEQTTKQYFWIVHAEGRHLYADVQDNDERNHIELFSDTEEGKQSGNLSVR